MSDVKPDYSAPADTFPKKGSNASGTQQGYMVEARLAYPEPKMVAGHLLDLRWKKLTFDPAKGGVPIGRGWPEYCGLMNYQAAQALRWWFIAEAERDYMSGCLETRLVKHRLVYSWSIEAIGASDLVSDRSNIMPTDAAIAKEARP